MQATTIRRSVDLSQYPDLVMIMLGFRLRGWRGLRAMRRIGPGMAKIMRDRPDGLLAHEGMKFSLLHFGFRQYWRDLDTLERFTRSEPHAGWWRSVRELSADAGFWHETYHARGGLQLFAPERQPVGPFMSARARIQGGAAEPRAAPQAVD